MTWNPFTLRRQLAEAEKMSANNREYARKARRALREIGNLRLDNEDVSRLVSEGLGTVVFSEEIVCPTITLV